MEFNKHDIYDKILDGTHSNQSIPRLKLLLRCLIIINQSKASAPSTTKVSPETEGYNPALVGLVEAGKLLSEIDLGNIGPTRMENVNDELAAGQKAVGDEFACAEGYWWCVCLERQRKDMSERATQNRVSEQENIADRWISMAQQNRMCQPEPNFEV